MKLQFPSHLLPDPTRPQSLTNYPKKLDFCPHAEDIYACEVSASNKCEIYCTGERYKMINIYSYCRRDYTHKIIDHMVRCFPDLFDTFAVRMSCNHEKCRNGVKVCSVDGCEYHTWGEKCCYHTYEYTRCMVDDCPIGFHVGPDDNNINRLCDEHQKDFYFDVSVRSVRPKWNLSITTPIGNWDARKSVIYKMFLEHRENKLTSTIPPLWLKHFTLPLEIIKRVYYRNMSQFRNIAYSVILFQTELELKMLEQQAKNGIDLDLILKPRDFKHDDYVGAIALLLHLPPPLFVLVFNCLNDHV